MRILYITNGFPYPLTSGYLRHYHLIRGLSARHEIDLASIVGRDFVPEHLGGMQPYARRIETVRSPVRSRSPWRKAARRAADLVVGSGSDVAGRALARSVQRLRGETTYDVALLSGKRTDPVLEHLRTLPIVVDLCDATSTRLVGSLPYASFPRSLAIRLELRRVRAVEARLIAAGRHLIFASRRDRDLLVGDASTRPVTVVPNGVDLAYWARRSPGLGGDEVVFLGAMSYRPNEDAAVHLLRDIMPIVWSAEPAVRVRIIGREPTEALRREASDPRVTITGFVDDVRPHLESGAVFAAPLRFAAGIQNKLLEAMAMELPVVTTAVAAAGLETDDGESAPVTVAEDAGPFASAIVAAIRRARADPRPHPEARQFVADRFVWDRAVSRLENVLVQAGRTA